jgi:hypothetical protein
MNCELTEQALIDESLPRPEGFEAHVASCPTCGALATAHRQALQLRGATLSRAHRRPLAEVRRRAGIVGGLMLAIGGGLGLVALEFSDEPAPAREVPGVIADVRPEQERMMVAPEQPEGGELFALAALQAFVAADTARDPRDDATAERVFGQLPRWTAPRRTQPIRSLGRAASPVVFTSEDSP